MVVPTNVRVGRLSALLVGVQSAKGTAVSNFTSGSVGRLWSEDVGVDASPLKSDAGEWMDLPQMGTEARHEIPALSEGSIVVKATPTSLNYLLRSNWGSYSGGVWALKQAVSEWLSIGWVESVLTGATEKFIRLWDAFLHRVIFRASPYEALSIEADYAAEQADTPVALDALAGITLPTPPMAVADKGVFPGRRVRFFRDPAGANVEFDLHSIAVSIDQGIGSHWDMASGVHRVWKSGHPGPRVRVELSAHVSDEAWGLMSRAISGSKDRYRLTAVCELTGQTLQMDFYEMDFEFSPVGHIGQRAVQFAGLGQAHRDGSGNFVTISLA
jgi:hypothetical protein